MRNDSATFGKVPKNAESFGRIPHDSESFRSVPKASERNENHTLTVREVARMFEAAGVARTERSIVNWCQPNKSGIARLDAYFDPNERRYFITPQSVESAIAEEKAKAAKGSQPSEPVGNIPNDSETAKRFDSKPIEMDAAETGELQKQVRDLEITNRVKDGIIDMLQKERERFGEERKGYIAQMVDGSRKIGELESMLHQLEAPRG